MTRQLTIEFLAHGEQGYVNAQAKYGRTPRPVPLKDWLTLEKRIAAGTVRKPVRKSAGIACPASRHGSPIETLTVEWLR